MHLAGRPHLAGMSTAFRLDFASPTIYRDLQTLESWPHPQTASVLPNYPSHIPLYLLLGLQLSTPQSHPQDVVDHGLASFV